MRLSGIIAMAILLNEACALDPYREISDFNQRVLACAHRLGPQLRHCINSLPLDVPPLEACAADLHTFATVHIIQFVVQMETPNHEHVTLLSRSAFLVETSTKMLQKALDLGSCAMLAGVAKVFGQTRTVLTEVADLAVAKYAMAPSGSRQRVQRELAESVVVLKKIVQSECCHNRKGRLLGVAFAGLMPQVCSQIRNYMAIICTPAIGVGLSLSEAHTIIEILRTLRALFSELLDVSDAESQFLGDLFSAIVDQLSFTHEQLGLAVGQLAIQVDGEMAAITGQVYDSNYFFGPRDVSQILQRLVDSIVEIAERILVLKTVDLFMHNGQEVYAYMLASAFNEMIAVLLTWAQAIMPQNIPLMEAFAATRRKFNDNVQKISEPHKK